VSPHPARPVALFVLGFGRSGTSALARVLGLSGAALPPGLLGATADNPRGYFEPRAAIHLNEVILRRRGSSGYDPGLPDPAVDPGAVSRIAAYLHTLPPAPLVVIKEPKITTVSGIWFAAARQAGFDVAVVIAVRHPEEVVGSLATRGGRQNYVRNSPELTGAWWLKYTLLAERDTRGLPRVVVDYANLLADWRREVKRIAVALGVDLSGTDDAAIDAFLTPELRHHRHHGPVPEPFGGGWLTTVYAALHAAARDDSWDTADLDRVYEAYRISESGFRTALDDYRRYQNLNRLMPPLAIKWSLAALALAHRRRGTWA
jgi:hypothetical protein